MLEPKSLHDDPGWRGGASCDWRLLATIGLASLVHGMLLLGLGLSEAELQVLPSADEAVEVEIVSYAGETSRSSPAAEAVASETAPPEAAKPTPAEPAPDVRKHELVPREQTAFIDNQQPAPPSTGTLSPSSVLAPHSGSEVNQAQANGAPQPGAAAVGGDGAGAERKGLSPAQLGLGGEVMRTAMTDMLAKEPEPRATNDAAQLRQELLDEDTRSGFGAGWELAALVRRAVSNRAPLGSTATFAFEIAASGAVTGIALQTATSAREEWMRLLERLRRAMIQLKRVPAAPLTAVLELRSRNTRRGGGSARLSEFDVANVGSPWMQQLNVRVLRQVSR